MNCIYIKHHFFTVKKTQTCCITDMHNWCFSACELHSKIITNCTEGNCILRHLILFAVIQVCSKSIACRNRKTCLFFYQTDNTLPIKFRKISSPILPSIKWTDTISILINIQNSMHLTGKTNCLHIFIRLP